MLEGTARVRGEWVVYDPQSFFAPEPFEENGSSAKHLAIVVNMGEARKMTGASSIPDMGAALLKGSAEVVVIKRGARGLSVFTRDQGGKTVHQTLPAYETQRVFPIGSGDVFSGVFALGWAVEHLEPLEAARRASQATAYYCGTRQLPIPENPEAELTAAFTPLRPPAEGPRPEVYLAGPFFTMAQRWLVREARDGLRAQDVAVFSPYHDVGVGDAADVVPQDIEALGRCQSVLAIVDGADAGTLFEVGYARAKGVPVIAIAENEPEEHLKMLTGTGCEVHNDFTTAVYRAAWAAMGAIGAPR
jgi:nucleoside 2-deoxyribosyltransferase